MAEVPVAGGDGPARRLFIAVDVPLPATQVVSAAIAPWREAFPDVRWVAPQNWHVTLKFLGRSPGRLVPWIEESVEGTVVAHAPVTASVRALGAFPSPGRARVLWAGIDDPASGLAALVGDLEARFADEFRAEMRRFHPHLTVARSEPPIRLPESYADTPLVSDPFVIERVVLFESHLRGSSPKYEPLRTFELGG